MIRIRLDAKSANGYIIKAVASPKIPIIIAPPKALPLAMALMRKKYTIPQGRIPFNIPSKKNDNVERDVSR